MAEPSSGAASAASAAEPSSSSNEPDSSKLQYLEQKYGSKAAHVHLSQPEVNAMVDKVLRDSPTVQYLLSSLQMVSEGVMWEGNTSTTPCSGKTATAAAAPHGTRCARGHALSHHQQLVQHTLLHHQHPAFPANPSAAVPAAYAVGAILPASQKALQSAWGEHVCSELLKTDQPAIG